MIPAARTMLTGRSYLLCVAIGMTGAVVLATALQTPTFAAQPRQTDEQNDPNSPERDAYNQYASSARGLQPAANDDLHAALDAAKHARALDPRDAEGRAAIARRAQDRITS